MFHRAPDRNTGQARKGSEGNTKGEKFVTRMVKDGHLIFFDEIKLDENGGEQFEEGEFCRQPAIPVPML
jgi:hypothetical protein